jgi:hypothetical protein
VKTVEEGTEWYKATTKYPDEVCEILAKYEWGGLRYTTKKEFKNMKKKTTKILKLRAHQLTGVEPSGTFHFHFSSGTEIAFI